MIVDRNNKIEITDEFKEVLEILENSTDHVFVTGKAGTGKSTLLNLFRKRTGKRVIVLAPTGVAALNVQGSTIHSFFRFPPSVITKDKIERQPEREEVYKAVEMIIIDEVSMLRADLLDGIDRSLRINRNNVMPFGGVRMVFIGDLHQLPPVVVNEERIYFTDYYTSEYFFSAHIISEIGLKVIELTKVFRQKDNFFIQLLNRIRENKTTPEDIFRLNGLYVITDFKKLVDETICLCSRKAAADHINDQKLQTLKTKELSFEAQIEGKFEKKQFPTDEILRLKEGAQVMLLRNDPDHRWVNGTIGRIKYLSGNKIRVSVEKQAYEINKETWEIIDYVYDKKKKELKENVVGSFLQYPIKLAWAITIHKSQGKTFENIVIDLGPGAFAHGQVYVALSRSTSLNGIRLNSYIKYNDLICDQRIIEFENRYFGK